MEGPSWLSISWLDAVTRSSWWPILLPFGYGVFRYLEYILKRRQERKPEIERIEQLIRLADLQEKLEKGRMSIAELNILRLQAIGDQVQTAATLSEKYASSAKLLIADLSTIAELYAAKNTKKDTSGKEFGLTQMDMNELSARNAAEAERDLSATIVNLVAHSSEQAVTALQRSQDAWHKYRKAEAEREAQLWQGGSIRPLMVNVKFEALTRERISTIQREIGEYGTSELTIRREKTPNNLFDHIELSVPKQRVQNLLGTPNYIAMDRYYYLYEDTQIEIGFSENGTVSEVVMALCEGYIYEGVAPAHATDIPLGKLTLADLLDHHGHHDIEYRHSNRTKEVFISGRSGPSGAWTEYSFGSLSVFNQIGRLKTTSFEWDHDADRLITDPKHILINWMALPSSTSDAPLFSWFIR